MTTERRNAAMLFSLFLLALAMLFIVGVSLLRRVGTDQATPSAFAPAPDASTVGPSEWSNASLDVDYVGSQQCQQCHAGRHDSYLATAHAIAMQPVRPEHEPPAGAYVHQRSGRHYEVQRKDGRLWHREWVEDDEGRIVAELEHPLEWLVGSGRHSRSYLVASGADLFESPITWYESDAAWSMSPGYDSPLHHSFERAVDGACLYCHVGRSEPRQTGAARVRILEASIGCERCHGPGKLHVEKHQATASKEQADTPSIDRTIVNPAHLSRARREDICAQCHLRGEATVLAEGARLEDFRPGARLSDTRVDYRSVTPSGQMKVVGHVEQMRHSRCYKQSAMTCTTCHDPHAANKPSPLRLRQVCLDCHTSETCREPIAARQRKNDNACVTCHMPSTPTDIPHIAFTHHRIGVHTERASPSAEQQDSRVDAERLAQLKPWNSLAHLSPWRRNRARGLAYFEFSQKAQDESVANQYRLIAKDALESLLGKRDPDSEVDAVLARLAFRKNPETAKHAALHALTDDRIRATTRTDMLQLLGEVSLQQGRVDDALGFLRELVSLRSRSGDHFLLALAYLEKRESDKAIRELHAAIQRNPFRAEFHAALAEGQQLAGDDLAAHRSREQAAALRKSQELQSPMP